MSFSLARQLASTPLMKKKARAGLATLIFELKWAVNLPAHYVTRAGPNLRPKSIESPLAHHLSHRFYLGSAHLRRLAWQTCGSRRLGLVSAAAASSPAWPRACRRLLLLGAAAAGSPFSSSGLAESICFLFSRLQQSQLGNGFITLHGHPSTLFRQHHLFLNRFIFLIHPVENEW